MLTFLKHYLFYLPRQYFAMTHVVRLVKCLSNSCPPFPAAPLSFWSSFFPAASLFLLSLFYCMLRLLSCCLLSLLVSFSCRPSFLLSPISCLSSFPAYPLFLLSLFSCCPSFLLAFFFSCCLPFPAVTLLLHAAHPFLLPSPFPASLFSCRPSFLLSPFPAYPLFQPPLSSVPVIFPEPVVLSDMYEEDRKRLHALTYAVPQPPPSTPCPETPLSSAVSPPLGECPRTHLSSSSFVSTHE